MPGMPTRTKDAPDVVPEVDQPGLGELRDVVTSYLGTKLRGGAPLRRNGLAGLSSAISNVPDGMPTPS